MMATTGLSWANFMLDSFFLSNAPAYPLLWAQHDPWLVALSVLMAVLASVLALQMAALARRADTGFMRQMARGSGALALGGGIWAMHFIGMLAFQTPIDIQYDLGITLLSLLIALLASWLAMHTLSEVQPSALHCLKVSAHRSTLAHHSCCRGWEHCGARMASNMLEPRSRRLEKCCTSLLSHQDCSMLRRQACYT